MAGFAPGSELAEYYSNVKRNGAADMFPQSLAAQSMEVGGIEKWDFYNILNRFKLRHNFLIPINFQFLFGFICLCLFLFVLTSIWHKYGTKSCTL
ncbi:MAG: hypothetical protein CVT49_07465 [candidate division Zixibacteria bacterium HGW-Zixibacteria-1]|nr:MAG: hypothetical protein CVT49_07465 [candidate division Zixibacteria bacterium HGW-Zixibacteria-1]